MDDWYGPDTATFGDRLAAARDAAGMKPETLAKRLGVKKSTLRSWEEDLSEPRANKLQMLSGILNVSMRWLLTGEGDGVEAPEQADAITGDLNEVLLELRSLQADLRVQAGRAAKLEKLLRKTLLENAG